MRLFQSALDTSSLDSPFFATLSVHGLHFTVCVPSICGKIRCTSKPSTLHNESWRGEDLGPIAMKRIASETKIQNSELNFPSFLGNGRHSEEIRITRHLLTNMTQVLPFLRKPNPVHELVISQTEEFHRLPDVPSTATSATTDLNLLIVHGFCCWFPQLSEGQRLGRGQSAYSQSC